MPFNGFLRLLIALVALGRRYFESFRYFNDFCSNRNTLFRPLECTIRQDYEFDASQSSGVSFGSSGEY